MPTIVEQLQLDALNEEISLSALLRRVNLTASKLGIASVEKWVYDELNGYKSDLPDYRIIRGQPKAFNRYSGWVPIVGEIGKITSEKKVYQSVASLEDLIDRCDDGQMIFPFPPNVVNEMNRIFSAEMSSYGTFFDRSQFIGILDRVRNLVQDWSIDLERSGIMGTEFSFTDVDKRKARQAMTVTKIGYVNSFVGNLGNNNTMEKVTIGDIKIDVVADLVAQVDDKRADLIAAGADEVALKGAIKALKQQLDQGAAKPAVLAGALQDLRNVLSGASGNLLASGAILGITKLLGG